MGVLDLFGETLLTKDGEKPTSEILKDKVVGIYFSAHWCPPCRGFTPKLAEAYTNHLQAKGMEIVFVSSDRDEESFTSYYGEQPWVALPFADRGRKDSLSKKFKVQGIPSFVVVDAEGNTITTDGRTAVAKDPTGENFPWKPKALAELLSFDIQTKAGTAPMASLDGKVLAIYFSAHWCGPCRGFTPELAKKYKEMKDAGLPIEILFVSSDRDEAAFDEYFAEQPWAALPYSQRALKVELSDYFGVEGIPSLVILDKDRSVITTNGRGAIMGDLADFPFYPKPVSDLAQGCDGINDTPSVVVLAEGADKDTKAAIMAALEPVAKEVVAKGKETKEDPEFLFFVATSGGGVVSRIREMCKLDKENAKGEAQTLLLVDCDDNGAYYRPAHSLTEEGVRALLEDYRAKKLTRLQFGQ
jgi:nucleoredoxin